ncbi:flavin reductase family protein [Streptomyces sp. SID12488]|uniref:flavin reductase family protein n=1 Tax=Streptomyces sp. SID12488 TaxID=2706040 RepID=UPI0013D946C8|nr:flavin reductase family protein [Streptomyces sp. SID12488]NEA67232.1 flavin reductase family protein [Streptomyces sp. SID12488]
MSDGATHSGTADAQAIDGRRFRDVLGNFPTSVVAVTTTDAEERPHGMVVGTFTSVSLDPPLVSFLADSSSATLRTIRTAGRFCANALAGNQERLSRQLAAGPTGQRFEGATWQASALGNPVLDGIIAWVDCAVEQIVGIGDHLLVVGRVRDLRVESMKTPLLFFRSGYGDYLSSASVLMDRLVGWDEIGR